MKLGLDWDGTVTRSPNLWLQVVKMFRAAGHKVYIVTMRYPEMEYEGLKVNECHDIPQEWLDNVDGLYATGRQAKHEFMLAQGICIDIWIDDNPKAVHQSAVGIWGHSYPPGHVHTPGDNEEAESPDRDQGLGAEQTLLSNHLHHEHSIHASQTHQASSETTHPS